MDQLVDEDALAIPEGPNTCSRSKKLNEADGGILKMSRKQEDCLGCSLITKTHSPQFKLLHLQADHHLGK